MSDLKSIVQRMNALKREKKFAEALSIFTTEIDKKYKIEEIRNDRMLISDMLHILYKLDKYEKGISFLENYLKINISQVEDNFTASMFGWCVFKQIKAKSGDEEHTDQDEDFLTHGTTRDESDEARKEYNRIVPVISRFPAYDKDNFRLVELLVLTFAKYVSKKSPGHWGLALELLEKYSPDDFSKDTFTVVIAGKPKELASNQEQWYALKSKALFELKQYTNCISFSENVLKLGILKHYNNDLWFKRRIALCNYLENNYEESIRGLREVLNHKKEWFIYFDLATVYKASGMTEKATDLMIESLISSIRIPDREKRWRVYYELGKLLKDQNESEIGLKHIQLAIKMRESMDWALPTDVKGYCEVNNIQDELELDVKTTHFELEKYWNTKKYASQPQYNGEIKKILENGLSGFIRSADNNEYYFKTKDFLGKKSDLIEHSQVTFYLEKGFDSKKGRETLNAVKVKLKA